MKKQFHLDNPKFIFSYSCICLLLILGVLFYIITLALKPVTEQPQPRHFLITNGQLSLQSSSLGMDVTIDTSVKLPKKYMIEWRPSEGVLMQWDSSKKILNNITNTYKGHPMTLSSEANRGSILWTTFNITNEKKLTLKAYLHKNDKTPAIYYDKIVLKSTDGVTFQVISNE